MAIAIPTYLSQQKKAKDAAAKQHLNYAYRAARGLVPEAGGSKFPAAASIVADVSASQPGLALTAGDCSQTTSNTQIVLDSGATTSTKAFFYAKSATGSIWRLTATPTGTPFYRALSNCSGPLSQAALTLSGNEITNAIRAKQGDGYLGESSYGVFDAGTNLLPNGGFEQNYTTGGWYDRGTPTTLSQVNDGKFGSKALQGVSSTGSTVLASGIGVPVTPGLPYTVSAWVRATPGVTLNIAYNERDGSDLYVNDYTATATATGNWQRLYVTRIPAAGDTFARVAIWTSTAATLTIDGVQLEQSYTATAYIDTPGGTTRPLATIQAPTSSVSVAQGWAAIRFRPAWSSTDQPEGPTPGVGPSAFRFGDAVTNNYVEAFFRDASYDWRMRLSDGTSSLDAVMPASHQPGDLITLIGTWTGVGGTATLGLSLNGSNFTTISGSVVPSVTTPRFTIAMGSSAIDGQVLWAASGTGTLTNTDAKAIYVFGNDDPLPNDFPAAAQAKMTWDAETGQVVTG